MSIISNNGGRAGSRNRIDRPSRASRKPVEPTTSPLPQSLDRLLDDVHRVLARSESSESDIAAAVDKLFHGLRLIRAAAHPQEWRSLIERGRAHALRQLVHEDPFTWRAFDKPRGYAGDAVMMDYIYSCEEDWQSPKASRLGQAVFNYTTSAPASAGVRERRCYIADLLNDIGRASKGPDVLAVAAGHLREASLSSAVRRNRFGRFVALDADAESVKEVDNRYGRFGVEAVEANIRQMLTGRLDLGSFDLIYTTGLYDYLADSTAKRLTANLFDRVQSGGRLVIANFLPEINDVGYMEMYMDWHLIYRDRGQMLNLADEIPHTSVDEVRILSERHDNVVTMELTKR